MADSEKTPDQPPLINHHSMDPAKKRNLCNLSERIMRMMEVQDDAKAGIKEVYQEAKNYGLSAKALRRAIKIRRNVDSNHQDMEDTRDFYLDVLKEGNV